MTQDTNDGAVARAVRRINDAWVSGRLDELRDAVDPEIVLATPGFGERIRGREAFVSGHREFAESVAILDFSELDIEVDVIGESAVATYRYRLDYERGGQRYESTGRDLYVFRHRDGQWRAVWRTLLDVEEQAI